MKSNCHRLRAVALAISASSLGLLGCVAEAPPDNAASAPAAPLVLGPETVVVPASADTSIRLPTPNQNFGADAALDVNRSLVAWTPAALAAAVGPQDFVVAARIELTITRNRLLRFSPGRVVSAHRMTKAWTETGATWQCAVDANPQNHRPDCAGATAWSMGPAPPNPYVPSASSAATILPAQAGVISLDVTADVRGFLGGGVPNHGWMLSSGLIASFADFGARETATPPRLVLTVQRCSASLCDDGNACTVDSCAAEGACAHAPAVDGIACSDGNACTGGDRCQAGSCAPGTTDVCAPPPIVINEIESNGGVPGDWVELYNQGTAPVDLSNWVFKDNDDTHGYRLPAGTVIAPGGYVVLDEAGFSFGLGAGDAARIYDATGTRLIDSHVWATHAATSYGRCPNGSGGFAVTASVTKGAANTCGAPDAGAPDAGADAGAPDGGAVGPVIVNEVESNGGFPGDWVEFYNPGTTPVDLSGWVFRDADETHNHVIAAGTSVPPGGYFVLDEAVFGFGLGGADSARLFAPGGTTVVASFAWTAHAVSTYGRCPNATGAFTTTTSSTKGAANDCGGTPIPDGGADAGADGGADGGGGISFGVWPGESTVATVDQVNAFAGNLSGLTYEPATASAPSLLWAVQNSPSTLYRLEWNESAFVKSPADGWAAGKTLVYPNGSGGPDSEGLTRAELGSSAMYVATERDNTISSISRLSVLRFDTSAPGAVLTATHEWNLNADLPTVGANLGLEAITWVPDSALVASGFIDERTSALYNPTAYPNHGTGVFFLGVEASGVIYAYVLDHTAGTAQKLATIASGFPGVMGLEFDRDRGTLWAYCDNTCGNRATILGIETRPGQPKFGRFDVRAGYQRPAGMPDINNEGIAIAPESECTGGLKSFFFSDDGNDNSHSLRRGSIVCAPLP